MISVAPIDNTSLVCDPSWVSNALEQAERLTSDTRAKKVLHNFAWNLLYNKVLHTFAWNPLYTLLSIIYHLSQFPLFAMILGMIVESVEKFKFLCTLLTLEWSLSSV